jgi:LuxR family transcriptional regulator, maltose regulon positive regulatory protein
MGTVSERSSSTGPAAEPTLSKRELEILEMAARGLTNDQMANDLHISIHGVKFHLASIYRKLGVSNRTEAAVRFLANGRTPLLRPESPQLAGDFSEGAK